MKDETHQILKEGKKRLDRFKSMSIQPEENKTDLHEYVAVRLDLLTGFYECSKYSYITQQEAAEELEGERYKLIKLVEVN